MLKFNRHIYLCSNTCRLKKREEFLKQGTDREAKKKRKSSGYDGLASDEDDERVEKNDVDPVPDAVMQLKLAEVIINEGLRAVNDEDRSQLLLEFWRSARKCGEIAERLERDLFDRLWQEKAHCEQAWLAKIERDAVDDPYALFDEAVERLPTEKMIRLYVDFCDHRVSSGSYLFRSSNTSYCMPFFAFILMLTDCIARSKRLIDM